MSGCPVEAELKLVLAYVEQDSYAESNGLRIGHGCHLHVSLSRLAENPSPAKSLSSGSEQQLREPLRSDITPWRLFWGRDATAQGWSHYRQGRGLVISPQYCARSGWREQPAPGHSESETNPQIGRSRPAARSSWRRRQNCRAKPGAAGPS